ncbi:unnamed protein product [Amoebophrya sp. A120]|nr:unnamed protein product [Amoebophrya sp. A120]|eukprot:GSA120T00018418001.1
MNLSRCSPRKNPQDPKKASWIHKMAGSGRIAGVVQLELGLLYKVFEVEFFGGTDAVGENPNQTIEDASEIKEAMGRILSADAGLVETYQATQDRFARDVLRVVVSALPALVEAHRKSVQTVAFVFGEAFPTEPFLHVFNSLVLLFELDHVQPTDPAAPELLGILASASTETTDSITVGELLLAQIAESFDYVLREVVLGGGEAAFSGTAGRLTCQAMWRVLCQCLNCSALSGSMFLELCGHEPRFPVAVARLLLNMEPCIARSVAELWVAKENLKGADAVAKKRQTRVAEETGALHDLYEFKRRLSMAFVEEELLDKMLRVSEVLFHEAYAESDDEEANLMGYQSFGEVMSSPTPNAKAQANANTYQSEKLRLRSEEFRVVFSCLCRCAREMCDMLTDPRYVLWATAKHKTFFKRLKRHLRLYGKHVVDFVHEKLFFSGKVVSPWDKLFPEMLDALLALKLLDPRIVMEGSLLPEDLLVQDRGPLHSNTPRYWSFHHFAGEVQPAAHARLVLLTIPLEDDTGANATEEQQAMHQQYLYETFFAPVANCSANPHAFWRVVIPWLSRFYVYRKKQDVAEYWSEQHAATAQFDEFLFDAADSDQHAGGAPAAARAEQLAGDAYDVHTRQTDDEPVSSPQRMVHSSEDFPPPGLEFYETQQRYRDDPALLLEASTAVVAIDEQTHVGAVLSSIANDTAGAGKSDVSAPDENKQPNLLQNVGNSSLSMMDPDAIPPHWRCHIDGRIMTNPVRFLSPSTGELFFYELATLQAWAAASGDVCPITGEAFTGDSLQRDGALEEEIRAGLAGHSVQNPG